MSPVARWRSPGSASLPATQTSPSSPIPNLGAPGTSTSPSSDLPKDNLPQVGHNKSSIPPEVPEPNEPSTISHPSALKSIEGTTPALTGPAEPVFAAPNKDFPSPNFEAAKPSFRGYSTEPKGAPSGGGSYSDVWRCPIQFLTPSKEQPTEAAVKVLRPAWLNSLSGAEGNEDERLQRRLQQEARTWMILPEHPNIVPLIGWTLRPKLSLISPWYNKGNLRRHLKNLSDSQRLRVLDGVAKGLDCLHSHNPPVVHGDLKPENILLSDQEKPLLADFGLSTILDEEKTYTPSHNGGGTVPWMSPECIAGDPRSPQSDVYSFGSLAFAILTGELPYDGLKDTEVVLRVCNTRSPNGPVEDWSRYPQLHGPVKDLLIDCWSRSPNARPSMSAVVERLTTLIQSPGLDSDAFSPD